MTRGYSRGIDKSNVGSFGERLAKEVTSKVEELVNTKKYGNDVVAKWAAETFVKAVSEEATKF